MTNDNDPFLEKVCYFDPFSIPIFKGTHLTISVSELKPVFRLKVTGAMLNSLE